MGRPRMRALRAMMSWMVTNMACPMCKAPVTFGGGMAMVKGSPVATSDGLKYPLSSHILYRRSSTSPCSKFFGRSAWLAPGETSEEEATDVAIARHRTKRLRLTPGVNL